MGVDGNTKGQSTQRYQWFFTFNNYEEQDIIRLKMRFSDLCKWYVFEKEIGENGTPHLQGNFSLKKKLRLTALKKWDKRIHWEPTRNVDAAINYCMKETDIYTNLDLDDYTEYDDVKWKPWQQDIIDKVAKPCKNDRTVNWVWDDEGNSGKSFLSKYLMRVENALVVDGKKGDIFHQIAKRKEEGIAIPIVIIDVPRASHSNLSYAAIECIKNGLVTSGKYEGGQYTFKSPHVYIFANEEPYLCRFSKDRWNVAEIN